MEKLAIIACGGRDFADAASLDAALTKLLPRLALVIEGEAKGADSLARDWALSHGIDVTKVPADWDTLGKRAGFVRNEAMLKKLLALRGSFNIGVVAFPGGVGTNMMCQLAHKSKVPVWHPLKAL